MQNKCYILFIGILLCISYEHGCTAQSIWNPSFEEDISQFIEDIFDCRHLPGLSFAVVQGGEKRMMKGYGYENVESKKPADQNSRFCIGSLTKAFTSTVMGQVLDDSGDEYSFNSFVTDLMGDDFEFSEEMRTDRATLVDLLAHRMGLAYYTNVWIVGLAEGPTRDEYCDRLKFLPPQPIAEGIDFRTDFRYNNFMFMLTSCAMQRLTQRRYEDLVNDYIFQPLGMDNSLFFSDIADSGQEIEDIIPSQYIYLTSNETVEWIHPYVAIGSVEPSDASGGLCSPATDMAEWMLMYLAKGYHGNTEVLKRETLDEIISPRQQENKPRIPHKKPYFPANLETPAYSLGWSFGDYRGYRTISHTGLVGGFSSRLTVFPDMDVSIFSSSNIEDGFDAQTAIHIYAADLMLEEQVWLNATTGCTYPEPWFSEAEEAMSSKTTEEKSSKNSHSVKTSPEEDLQPSASRWAAENHEKYVGLYGHLLLGNTSIWYNESDENLWVQSGRLAIGRLLVLPQNEDIGLIELHGPLWYVAWDMKPPLEFQDLVDDRYQTIVGWAYDPAIPPIFERGLEWDDLPGDDVDPVTCTAGHSDPALGSMLILVSIAFYKLAM